MIYCTDGRCGATIDVYESHGTIFAQCSNGRGMQSSDDDIFYATELCQGCNLANIPQQYPYSYDDDWSDDDDDDDDGDLSCFE